MISPLRFEIASLSNDWASRSGKSEVTNEQLPKLAMEHHRPVTAIPQ
ncbi:MAG: hypothetical protein ACMVP2_25020 [Imperialibacter sp.]